MWLLAAAGCGDNVAPQAGSEGDETSTADPATDDIVEATSDGSCEDFRDCGPKEVCVEAACLPLGACESARHCPSGTVCADGTCTDLPPIAGCSSSVSATRRFSVDHPDDDAPPLGSVDTDGDGIREVVLGLNQGVMVVASNSDPWVLANLSKVLAFARHDFDHDGREDLLIGSDRLYSWRGATGELLDNSGSLPRTAVLELVPRAARWLCPTGVDGCSGIEMLSLFDEPEGVRVSSGVDNGALGLAYGNVVGTDEPEAVVDQRDGVTVGAFQHPLEDPAVSGSGRIVAADLDASGYAEIVRLWSEANESLLWGAPDASTVSLVVSDGEQLSVTARYKLPARLGRIRAGDFFGDAREEVVIGTREGVLIWSAPLDPGGGCIHTLDFGSSISGLAVDDVTGDGRANLILTMSFSTGVWAVD